MENETGSIKETNWDFTQILAKSLIQYTSMERHHIKTTNYPI